MQSQVLSSYNFCQTVIGLVYMRISHMPNFATIPRFHHLIDAPTTTKWRKYCQIDITPASDLFENQSKFIVYLSTVGIIATIASSFYLFVFSSNKFTNSSLFRQKFRDNSFSLLAVEFFIVLYKVKISSTRGNRIFNRLTLKLKAVSFSNSI